jgi:PadR family transcriptional regulator PadR
MARLVPVGQSVLEHRRCVVASGDPLRHKGKDLTIPCVTREKDRTMAATESDLLRSSLDLLVLKALSWGPMHGYDISEWIEHATDSLLLLEEGTLYPALHRLERRGWITAEWGVSANNRRAKFYKLSAAGRARFRAEAPVWHRHAEAIAIALRGTSPETA